MLKYKLFALVVSSAFLISGCGAGCNSGDGKKIGQIVKLGNHGMFCSTYEGELVRGGFNDGSGVNGSTLHFSIRSKKIYDGLMEAMENQQEVELSYSKHEFYGPCYSETGIIVTGFKVLNHKKESEVETKEVVKELIQFEDDKL